MNIDELAESGNFQGFFQFEFEESLRRLLHETTDVNFMLPVEFTFTPVSNQQFTGRFVGQVDTPDGQHGCTAGSFILRLPDGLEAGDAGQVLDRATVEISIEVFPEGAAAQTA